MSVSMQAMTHTASPYACDSGAAQTCDARLSPAACYTGADTEEEVKSQPAKSAAKPVKKPILPDSVKAIAKVWLQPLSCCVTLSSSTHGRLRGH